MNKKIETLEEELFCLKIELETLSGVILRNESERWIPNYLFPSTEHSHLERYKLASQFAKDKIVLDIASGSGKGSFLLKTEGKAFKVIGNDLDKDAIRYSNHRYKLEGVEFFESDASKLKYDSEFDLIVSFETIEHIDFYNEYLIALKNSLKADGQLLISTPISSQSINTNPSNPYHVCEWGFEEFQNLIKNYFEIEKIYVQLYPQKIFQLSKKSLLERLKNKVFRKKSYVDFNLDYKNSFIKEFNGQYLEELKTIDNCGYQIILAKRK